MATSLESGFVDRVYPLDGGLAFTPNKEMYSPGHFEGERLALCCNAYLISASPDRNRALVSHGFVGSRVTRENSY